MPSPARCGLEGFAPNPHTIAEMISASTDRISPMAITAPTIVRSCEIPGSPSSFGVMSTSIGSMNGRLGTTAVIRSNTASSFEADDQPPIRASAGVGLPVRCAAGSCRSMLAKKSAANGSFLRAL